jgi:hypothetical protein
MMSRSWYGVSDQEDTAGGAPAEGRGRCGGRAAREIPGIHTMLIQMDFCFSSV